MKMSDVRIGMRLRSTRVRVSPRGRMTPEYGDEIEVTGLKTHVYEIDPQWAPAAYSHAVRVTVEVQAFTYRIPDEIEIHGPHWSMTYARDGGEYFACVGSGGDIDYEPMQSPALTAEIAEREEMLETIQNAVPVMDDSRPSEGW